MDDMSMDITEYPITVNISNPNKSYYAPACRNCQSNQCKNCALPISKEKTLRDILTQLTHKTKFNDNKRFL